MNMCDGSVASGRALFRVADVVFDTSFFIDLRRGNSPSASELWDSVEAGQVTGAYSAVTVYELWVGRSFSRDEELFYLSNFALLEDLAISSSAAQSAGLWLRGRPDISEKLFRDALIAAAAEEDGAAVCTRNVRDFQRFPSIQIRPY
jgi:predicted nucleic acid-binding protein